MKTSTLVAAGSCAIGVLIVVLAFQYPVKAGLFPKLVGVPFLVLALLQLGVELRGDAPKSADKTKLEAKDVSDLVAICWVIFLPVIVYLCGFLVGMSLYILFFVKWNDKGWGTAITLAFIIMAIYYIGFVMALKIPLYHGLFASLLE